MSTDLVFSRLLDKQSEPIQLTAPVAVSELPTPALVLERSILQRNIESMRDFLAAEGKGFRPHSKTHKCPVIAKLQMEAGAVGVCAAKLSEAVALINSGLTKILITSPIVSKSKLEILNKVLPPGSDHDINIVIDSMIGLEGLLECVDTDKFIGVLIDLDISMARTGLRSDEELLSLLEKIQKTDRIKFKGIQHYAGHLMHLDDYEKRKEKSLKAWQTLEDKFLMLERSGFSCEIVTGGGTGSYDIDVLVERLTDLQVGSYIFMDEEYRSIPTKTETRFTEFTPSLTVACTAISQPKKGMITVDGGYKAFASDSVNPVCDEIEGVDFHFAGDEHGVLVLGDSDASIKVGDVVRFVTPHCDPTVNLHDFYWILEEDDLIHSCWPIVGRGCSW